MKHTYARAILVLTAAVLTPLLAPAPAVAEDTCDDAVEIISIDVTPATINLQHHGAWLVIHADIYYEDVDSVVLYLNWNENTTEDDAFECWTKADHLGNLIAKVNIRKLDQLAGALDGFNTFTLKGENQEGQPFCGEEEVMIIDHGPDTSPPRPGGK